MDKDLDNVVVCVRLRGPDAARFWRVMDAAKHRNPYIDRSNVMRELLGLDPPGALTADEIKHFQGHNAVLKNGVEVAPTGSKIAFGTHEMPKKRKLQK